MMRRRAVGAQLGAALLNRQSSSLLQDILQGSFLHEVLAPPHQSVNWLSDELRVTPSPSPQLLRRQPSAGDQCRAPDTGEKQ